MAFNGFEIENGLLLKYTGTDAVVKIPEEVTGISGFAFSGQESITSIAIPETVTTIGEGAFNKCIGLTSIVIPDSVTEIAPRTFTGAKD